MDYREFQEKYGTKGKKKKGLKYHNKKTNYNGVTFDSKYEGNVASDLDWLVKSGELKGYDRQVTIEFNIKFVNNIPILTNELGITLKNQGIKFIHVVNYRVDFVLFHNDGTETWLEAKGMETEPYRIKRNLTEALIYNMFNIKYEVVKQRQNKYAAKNQLKFKKGR